ncbi:MAG: polysaccharide biosynthesis/export family protein [Crocinitomicaceae bacterium]|nr:polysaccharide biosynthesis/export family protein [Crocinitomicaceae bacterium]
MRVITDSIYLQKLIIMVLYRSLLRITLILFLLLSSCGTYDKLVYFQDGDIIGGELNCQSYTPTFQPDDLLSISIMSENPIDAEPFNLPAELTTLSKSNNGYYNGIPSSGGYLVDSLGNVSLPIIGIIQISGMTRIEASEFILKKLEHFLVKPSIQISILNFKITVLGDVRAPGTFKIPNERITILESLGLAGDLNITGNRKNVAVIRNEGATKNLYIIDLTSNSMFTSPVYYLNQNDVVYVEPNQAKRLGSTTGYKFCSFIISISSVFFTLTILLTK